MSITVTTDVFCDSCPAWIAGVTGGRSDAPGARAEAKRCGWKRRKGRDLCPECAAASAS